MIRKSLLYTVLAIFSLSCNLQEVEVPEVYQGEWLIKDWKLYWGKNNMTPLFELPNLSNSVFEIASGGGYILREESSKRDGKIFPFLIFTDPRYYRNDSSEAIGNYQELSSGDLMFNIGTDAYYTKRVASSKDSLVLETYSDFDTFDGGNTYFYKLGLITGEEKAARANSQADFGNGSVLGFKYGLYKGFIEKYQELFDATGREDYFEGIFADPLRAYSKGFIDGVNNVLDNSDPQFNDGFQQSEATERTNGQTLASELFLEDRKIYRIRYYFTKK